MTVAELIKKLEEFPPEAKVVIPGDFGLHYDELEVVWDPTQDEPQAQVVIW